MLKMATPCLFEEDKCGQRAQGVKAGSPTGSAVSCPASTFPVQLPSRVSWDAAQGLAIHKETQMELLDSSFGLLQAFGK